MSLPPSSLTASPSPPALRPAGPPHCHFFHVYDNHPKKARTAGASLCHHAFLLIPPFLSPTPTFPKFYNPSTVFLGTSINHQLPAYSQPLSGECSHFLPASMVCNGAAIGWNRPSFGVTILCFAGHLESLVHLHSK